VSLDSVMASTLRSRRFPARPKVYEVLEVDLGFLFAWVLWSLVL